MKKIISIFLVVFMVFQTFPTQLLADLGPSDAEIYINGDSASIEDFSFNNAPVRYYGDSISFSVSVGSDPVYMYLDSDGVDASDLESAVWNVITAGRLTLLPGDYFLGYSAVIDSVTNDFIGGNFGLRVQKATLSTPAGSAWKTGTTASWNQVTTTVSGGTLDADAISGYNVILYRDASKIAEVQTAASVYEYDFTTYFTQAGVYTFTVSAIANSAKSDRYISSAVAAPASKRAVSVTVVKDRGITSVSSSSFLMVPGSATGGTVTLTAVMESGRTFGTWVGSTTGATFSSATAQTMDLTLTDDYAANTLTVYACSIDDIVPEIIYFGEASGTDAKKKLTASFKDLDNAVAAYAITTQSDYAQVSDWITVSDAGIGVTKTVSYTLTESGIYYLYVRDAAGNYTVSSPISVTEVRYHDYSEGTGVTDLTEYWIGDGSYSFVSTNRTAFDFDGYFLDPGYQNAAGTGLSAYNALGVDIYAKWTRQNAVITDFSEGFVKTYDGLENTLSVSIANTEGTITYQWYCNNTAIEGATASSYKIKNVAQSGNYYVIVRIEAEGEAKTATSDAVFCSVLPAAMDITAISKTISYKGAAPTYTYEASGYVNGETSSVLTVGTLSCVYDPADAENNAAGSYTISISGFSAANYTITYHDGTLTVSPYQADKTDTEITATIEEDEFFYVPAGIQPVPTVLFGTTPMSSDDYDVTYENYDMVGEAFVVVTFKGNYTGSISIPYTILSSTFDSSVTFSGWTYGETHSAAVVTANPEDAEVTFYYRKSDEARSAAVTTCPVNAGSYIVYAVIADSANYTGLATEDVAFTIAKRAITITAASDSWTYDGFLHSNPEYTVTGTFAGSDSLISVTVTATIVNVGSVENEVTGYRLSSSTLASNYNITLVSGTLTVETQMLTVPSGHDWNGYGAVVSWVPVTKDNLTVEYELKLYRVANAVYTLVDTVTTEENQYDFSDIIRADCAAQNGAQSYVYTLQTLTKGGTAVANFDNSEASSYGNVIHTAKVTISAHEGFATATIEGASAYYLIAGETVNITATVNTGYYESSTVWTTSDAALTIEAADELTTVVTLSSTLAEKKTNIVLSAHAYDAYPYVTNFTAESAADHKSVAFSFRVYDSRAVVAWALLADSSYPSATDSRWNEITPATSFSTTVSVTTAGNYHLYVKDNGGNISSSGEVIAVYEIAFAGGDGATGTMADLLKIQNETLTLPAITFNRPGFVFKNWAGTSGTYADGATYSNNGSETLTAQWASANFSFTINFFMMKTDGTYATTADLTRSYTASYNQLVDPADAQYAEVLTGFSLDDGEGLNDSVHITSDGTVLDVYYKRNTYTITYSYKKPGDSSRTEIVQSYRYGEAVTTPDKPSVSGYGFIGWTFPQAGSVPTTMPATNLTATGTFGVYSCNYEIHYYVENLDASTGYTMVSTLTEQKGTYHNSSVFYDIAGAIEIIGFSPAGVVMSHGADGGATPDDFDDEAQDTASSISGDKLYVSVYYSRNSYDLSLNVYQGGRGASNLKYTYSWSLRYGETITPDIYAHYNEANWPHGTDYQLATYSDWSTGLTPPTTMPSGPVSVSRDFVSTVISSYNVEVYLEGVTENSYSLVSTLMFYGHIGELVTLGGTDSSTINYNNFSGTIDYFDRYHLDPDASNILSGVVTDVTYGDDPIVLRAYFARNTYNTTYSYYSNDGTTDEYTLLATATYSARWGTTHTIEALKLFSGDGADFSDAANYTIAEPTIAGVYDFKSNYYLASYAGNAIGSFRYDKAADLTATRQYNQYFTNNYLNVYYTAVDPDDQYYVTVRIQKRGLTNYSSIPDQEYQYTVGGTAYGIRVANKSYIFENTFTDSTDPLYAGYPGAARLHGDRNYTGNLNPGFTAVTDGGKTGYAKDGYLYIADESNQFVNGAYVGFTYGSSMIGHNGIAAILSEYQTNETSDDNRFNAYYNNASIGGLLQGNATMTITFGYLPPYTVYYMVGGVTCVGHRHNRGTTVKANCTHDLFVENEGFSIVWYFDTFFTQKATTFTINGNTKLYGRYEKNTVVSYEYVYYQLPQDISADGGTYDYITENDLTNPDIASHITTSTVTTTLATETDGVAAGTEIDTVSYYYDGILVMICKEHPSLTFTNVSLDISDYMLENFTYDDTKQDSSLMNCTQAQGLTLRAYLNRDTYNFTYNAKNTYLTKEETTVYRVGAQITMPEPTKRGYTLNGYEFKYWDSEQEKFVESGVSVENGGVFTMPACDVYATAQYDPAMVDQLIVHYFADTEGSYQKDLYQSMASASGISVGLSFNGVAHNGYQYAQGYSFTDGDLTFYFSKGTEKSGTVFLSVSDLVAASETHTVRNESYKMVKTYLIDDFAAFNFDNAQKYYDQSTRTYSNKNTEFTVNEGMELTYYYSRANQSIGLSVKSSDNGSCGLTEVVGAGTYPYGKQVTIHATVPVGYSFVGWYNAADVLDGYDPSSLMTPADYELVEDLSELTAVSSSAEYTFAITENINLVAVVLPDEVSITIPTIAPAVGGSSGGTGLNLIYGYENNQDNVLAVTVTLPDDENDYTQVAGYQWYYVEEGVATILTGETSSTYRVPTGKNADTYYYECKVTLVNSANGRTLTVSSADFAVNVLKADIFIYATGYTGTYDGKSHGFNLYVPSGIGTYTLYYSETPLDSTNYTTGSTTAPKYNDVLLDASGNVIPHTVYIYLHSTDGNHNDATETTTVTLRPLTLGIRGGFSYFSKIYDGTVDVPGTSIEEDTLMYNLVHNGFFTITGMLSADTVKGYLLSCDAVFNSADVDFANAILISNMSLIDAEGVKNPNYRFSPTYSVTISGYITARTVTGSWDTDTSYEYDGTAHAPAFTPVLDDLMTAEGVSVSVLGSRSNVGSYTATTSISVTASGARSTNYRLQTATKAFTVTAREVTVSFENDTITYDGASHTLSVLTFEEGSLVTGSTYTVKPSASYILAGDYAVSPKEFTVYDSAHIDVTDNYSITYEPGTLTISKKKLTLSGFTASSKVYDGTTAVTLDKTAGELAGIVTGDTVTFDASKVTGAFAAAAVGTTTVNLSYGDGILQGASVANYEFDGLNSQQTADSSITKKSLVIKANDASVIYGENLSFSVAYTGFVNGEDASVLTGDLAYSIRLKNSSDTYTAYSTSVSVGTYEIFVDISGLEADNYELSADTALGALKVDKRALTLAPVEDKVVTKTYDGTTAARSYIDSTFYTFTAVTGITASGIVNGDTVGLADFGAAYGNKNADTWKVYLANASLNNSNYYLDNNAIVLTGRINKASLNISVKAVSITYGTASFTYTPEYSGFVNGETASVLGGTAVYTTTYDTSAAATRKVGSYTLSVSGLTAVNYNITFTDGTLTVNPAVITLTGNTRSKTYGESTYTWAGNGVPGSMSGFKWDDTEADVSGTTLITAVIHDELPGTYPLNFDVSGLVLANYTFTSVPGSEIINKADLTISGITLTSKVYDGTTDLLASQVVENAVTKTGLLPEDAAGYGITVTGKYADKNAGTGINVELNIALNAYLAARYKLSASSQNSATAGITARPITVTAQPESRTYGSAKPSFTYSIGNMVSGESLASGSDLTGTVVYACDYEQNDNVGSYTITPSGITSAGNYSITFIDGTLTITQATLGTPTVVFSTDDFGTVEWSSVSGIGDVAVDHYIVTLKKDGTVVYTSGAQTGLSLNLASTIRDNGKGCYTASVYAVASTDNNTDRANVANGVAGTSGNQYAVQVNVVFASDAISQAGGSSTSVEGAASYIMMAGESGKTIYAQAVNDTGYSVKSVTTNSVLATVSGTSSVAGDPAKLEYNGTLSLSLGYASSSDITVTVTLNAYAATADLALAGNPGTAKFSYLAADAPHVIATPSVEAGDNITTAGYSYSYQWYLKESATGGYNLQSQNTADFTFPQNKNAYTNYRVRCVMTSTRLDNGLTDTVTKEFVIIIQKGDLTPVLSISGWTYGETRNTPSVTGNLENGEETYYYSTANDDSAPWTTNVPTEAGTYYVKILIKATANYERYEMTSSMAKQFTIAQATFDTPTGLSFNPNTGIASWNVVDTVYENANVSPASNSQPKYLVTMYRDAVEYYTETVGVGVLTLDLADQINDIGLYTVDVKAVPQATDTNTLESSKCTAITAADISARISISDSSQTYTETVKTKTYDADPYILAIVNPVEGSTFQWFKDGVAISGATGDTYTVANVADSGKYVVEITLGSVTRTAFATATLNRKALTVTANPKTITYGDEPANDGVSYSGFATGEDKNNLTGTLNINVAYSQYQDVGTYKITPSGYNEENYSITYVQGDLTVSKKSITVSADANQKKTFGQADPTFAYTPVGLVNGDTLTGALTRANVTTQDAGEYEIQIGTLAHKNYDIIYTPATFVIEKAELTNVSVAQNGKLTYNGAGQTAAVNKTSTAVNNNAVTFTYRANTTDAYASTVPSFKNAGSYTVYYKATAANHNDYTGSFTVTIDKKAMTITANPKTITFGDAPVNAGYTQTGLVPTDSFSEQVQGSASYSYTYSQYQPSGSYEIKVTGFTSDNYDIKFANGTLTVDKANLANVTAAQSGTLTYKGIAQTATVATTATSVHDETVTFTYSKSATGTFTTTVPSWTDAGSYTVYYKASAPSHNDTTGSFTVTIGKKGLTVHALNHSIVYGAAPTNNGIEGIGFENGETLAVLSGSVSYTYSYTRYGNIGFYTITPAGLTSGNYNINFTDGVLTVTAKPITVKAEIKTKVYGTADPTLTYVATGLENGDTLSGELKRVAGENVADYTIEQNTLGVADTNYSITYTSANLSITNATLTGVTVAQNGKLTYSGLAQSAGVTKTATAVNDLEVSFTYSTSATGTFASTVPGFTNADSYTVYYKASAANHFDATGSFTVTIDKKALTVTANAHTITYGDAPGNNGVTCTGFVNGEDESVLSGTLGYDYGYNQFGDAGLHTDAITPKGYTSSNYAITFESGDLTVNKKAITVTANSGQQKVYNSSDPTLAYTAVGLVNNDKLTGALTRVAGENVGTYTISIGTLAHKNYTFTVPTDQVFTIVNANLSGVSVAQKNSLAYTGADQIAEVTTKATSVNSQPVTFTYSTSATGTFSSTVPAFQTAGNHTVYYKASAPNHNTATGSFIVNIGQKTLTITAKPKTIIYGAAPSNAGFEVTGLATGDTLESVTTGIVSYAYDYAQYGNVGSYTITPSGLSSDNYVISYVSGVLTVDKASLTNVSVTQKNALTYSGVDQTPEATVVYTAVDGNTSYTIGYRLSGETVYGGMPSFKNANTYTVYYKLEVANHKVVEDSFTVTIGKKAITVRPNDKTIIYGQDVANNGVTATGMVDSEAIVYTYSYTYSQYGNVGTYEISADGSSANYDITFQKGVLTVDPKSITVEAKTKSKVYHTADPDLDFEVDGLVNGDVLTGALKRAEGENVGDYAIAQNTLGVADTNYSITYTSADLSITPATMTGVSVSQKGSLTYTASAQTAERNFTGSTVDGCTISYAYRLNDSEAYGAMPAFTNADTYTVYYEATAPNHTAVTGSFSVTIDKADLTISANTHTRAYGNLAGNSGVTYVGFVGGEDESVLGGNLTFAYDYELSTVVGTYEDVITPSGLTSSNYAITFEKGDLVVQPKAITIQATASQSKVYGTSDPTFAYTTDGLEFSDTLSGALSREAGENVGEYDITLGTLANANYTLTLNSEKFAITNAAITGISAAQNGTLSYKGVAQKAGVTTAATTVNAEATTFVYSLTQDGTYTEEMPDVTNADDYTVYYKVSAPNHETEEGFFTVTVDKAALSVIADDHSIVYGDAVANGGYHFEGFQNGETEADLTGSANITVNSVLGDPVGTYSIDITGFSSDNYTITEVSGTLTVKAADIADVTVVQDEELTYLGKLQSYAVATTATSKLDQTITFTYSLSPNGPFTTEVPEILHAGTTTVYYHVDAPNHNTYTGSFKVQMAKANLVITAKATTLTYGDNLRGNGLSYAGFLESDSASDLSGYVTYSSSYRRGSKVGTYKIAPSGLSSRDYNITYKEGTLTVQKKTLTVTVDNVSLTFGDDPIGSKARFEGFISGENQNVLGGDLLFTYGGYSKGSPCGAYKLTPYGFTSGNYKLVYKSAVINVGKAEIEKADIAQKGNLIYNGSAQTPVLTEDVVTVLDTDYTLFYRLSEEEEYSTVLPTVTDRGTYTLYYKLEAKNHESVEGSAEINVLLAEVPDRANITDLTHVEDQTGGLRIWIYNGIETVIKTKDYPASYSGLEDWVAIMNPAGYGNETTLKVELLDFENPYSTDAKERIMSLRLTQEHNDILAQTEQGTYYVCILLPKEFRSQQTLWVLREDGTYDELVREGNYGIFETEELGEFEIYGTRKVINLIPLIILLSVLFIITVIIKIREDKKRKKNQKDSQYAYCISWPLLLLTVTVIPRYGVEICIGLGILLLIGITFMVIAAVKEKRSRDEQGNQD